MSEWVNEWVSEQVNKWVSGWVGEWVCKWTLKWAIRVSAMMECASREAMAEYELWNIRANSFRVRSVNKTITHQITQRYVHSLFVDYKNGNKCQILRMRHWTTANIKITFIVYHERRYIITEAHSEGIPKLRPVLAVREVTSWVVKEMVDSVFSYLWGK